MGTDLPLLWFPILVLLCAQFRIKKSWGQTAGYAGVKPPRVLFWTLTSLLQLAAAGSFMLASSTWVDPRQRGCGVGVRSPRPAAPTLFPAKWAGGLGQQPLFLRRKAWHRREHWSSVKAREPTVTAHGPTAWKPNFS